MTTPKKLRLVLDYSAIEFPTDRITVAAIRRVHPDGFDTEPAEGFGHAEPLGGLNLAIAIERLLARAAFDRACGRATDTLQRTATDRTGCVEELTAYYRTYGVAEGPQQTEQLVRRIESQAAAQVKRRG